MGSLEKELSVGLRIDFSFCEAIYNSGKDRVLPKLFIIHF